jgi:hypothetical protein
VRLREIAFASKFIEVVIVIYFLVVAVLRFSFLCCVSSADHSQPL